MMAIVLLTSKTPPIGLQLMETSETQEQVRVIHAIVTPKCFLELDLLTAT